VILNITRRLTNQDAFEIAMLHLLNQGHSCLSASGQPRYRTPRGKSAIGALIPDQLYVPSLEGKKLQHWLTTRDAEYTALRERFAGVTPSLLGDLQDLHDRSGACMPSLYRHLVLAGAQRIAQSFKLSMKLVQRCATYQHIKAPQILSPNRKRAIPVAAAAIETPTAVAMPVSVAVSAAVAVPVSAAAPASVAVSAPVQVSAAAEVPAAVAVSATPDTPPAPDVPTAAPAVNPTPAPQALQLTERPEDELDLIARGIAKAIAAATMPGLDRQSGRR
jgi:hypothetical protein